MMPRYLVNSNMKTPHKRWVPPKNGLKAGWAKFEGRPDFVVGSSHSMADCRYVQFYLGSEKIKGQGKDGMPIFEKSFLEELHDRGYDISTLKFSVERYK
jgi:hypothetical protein